VILETPESLPLGPGECQTVRDYASLLDHGVRLGLEARAHAGGTLPAIVERTLGDGRVLDVVDLSTDQPRVPDEVVYSRLFGPGSHNMWQFDDAELRRLDRGTDDVKSVAYAFHGVRMYADAARFLTFRRTGKFPPATSSRGLASFEEVLAPDVRLPATREALLGAHGWKVFDLDDRTRAHVSEVLRALPDREYPSLEDLLTAAGRQFELRG
jgi:hypothetical protein